MAEERLRPGIRDLALASLPSLGLAMLGAGQPGTMGPSGWSPIGYGWGRAWPAGLALDAVMWLAAFGAVRATTSGRRAAWLLACGLCLAGALLGPGIVLILQNLSLG